MNRDAVWIYDTIDSNSEIKNNFTKYLKESCWKCSDLHISCKYFLNYAFA